MISWWHTCRTSQGAHLADCTGRSASETNLLRESSTSSLRMLGTRILAGDTMVIPGFIPQPTLIIGIYWIGIGLQPGIGILGLVWAESPESSQFLYWNISELFGILAPFYRQGSTLCKRDKPSDNKWYPLLHSQKGFRWNWKLQLQHIQYAKMRLDSTF